MNIPKPWLLLDELANVPKCAGGYDAFERWFVRLVEDYTTDAELRKETVRDWLIANANPSEFVEAGLTEKNDIVLQWRDE